MAIFVTMQVGPVDWAKFSNAMQTLSGAPAPGRNSYRVYRMQSDPRNVLVVEEWDSHDSMHTYQDKVGPEFQRLAGTEGMNWQVALWEAAT
jgi:quinol monooxygenase YgiN